MTIAAYIAVVPLLFGTPFAVAHAATENHTVAAVDGALITHSMIVCGPLLRNDPGACHLAEQHRLDRLITRRWIDAAARLNKITLTPAQNDDVEKKVSAQRAAIVVAAARFHLLATLILRLREGMDIASVYAEAASKGLTAADVDEEAALVPTLAMAQRTAAKDYLAEGEQADRDFRRRQAILQHLRVLVRTRATERGQTFDQASSELWSEISSATSTRIIDAQYQSPDAKGILDHE